MDYKQTVIIIGAGFLAANALLLGMGTLFFMAAVVAGIPLLGYLCCRLLAGGLSCERTVNDRVFPGELIGVTLSLRNQGRLPRLGVTVEDELPPGLEAEQPPRFYFPVLWPGRQLQVSYQAVARRRGAYRFDALTAAVSDPPGLTEREVPVPAPGEAIVYPLPLPMTSWVLGGTLSYADAGREHMAAGQGGDFYSIREYAPGDELRRIHWRSTARLGRLAVIEFERIQAADLLVVLDLLAGSEVGEGEHTTLETAVVVAASLLDYALRARAAAVLVCQDAAGPHQVTMRSEADYFQALEVLARARADGSRSLSEVLSALDPALLARYSPVLITAVPDPELPGQLHQCVRASLSCMALLVDPAAHHAEGASHQLFATFAHELAAAGALVQVLTSPEDLPRAASSLPVGWQR